MSENVLGIHDSTYHVNDFCRYADENDTTELNPTLVDGSENVPTTPLTPDPGLSLSLMFSEREM